MTENGAASAFANDPIVIAIRDNRWGGVFGDVFDNDPIYYEHHEGKADHPYPEGNGDYHPGITDGFVRRGNHYVLVFVTKQGEVNIDMGYHEDEDVAWLT